MLTSPTKAPEGLTLRKADNKTGYYGVRHKPHARKSKPYRAEVRRGGKLVYLGYFATAEEAALCVARSPEGQAAANKAAAAAPLTSEEARQQAQAEGLTLRGADTKTGYFGVYNPQASKPKPYQAQVWRGGEQVHLGSFATAEEAALCVARSPEGQAAANKAAAAAPLTSEEARQQAQAEGLTLLKADSKTGYFNVLYLNKSCKSKPYEARVWRGGKQVHLGSFATAEEAALCIARSPEGQAAAKIKAAAVAPLTSEEARQQAQAEGLTLLVADSMAGYFGVSHKPQTSKSKPYEARVWRGGELVHLGTFATAEEAALCVARSPEGQAAAERAAAAPQPRRSEEEAQGNAPATRSRAVLKEEGAVPPMPAGAFVKEESTIPPMPPSAFVKEEVVVKQEVILKREHEGVVDKGGPKRRRNA